MVARGRPRGDLRRQSDELILICKYKMEIRAVDTQPSKIPLIGAVSLSSWRGVCMMRSSLATFARCRAGRFPL